MLNIGSGNAVGLTICPGLKDGADACSSKVAAICKGQADVSDHERQMGRIDILLGDARARDGSHPFVP